VSTRGHRRLRSVARVRSVKPTRLICVPHARGGPADRASLSHAAFNLAARAGHAPTRPLRAAFRYPHPGAVARPCRTSRSFPRTCRLVRRRSWGSFALRRFDPASGWPWHFCPTGPTCRSRHSVRASRLIFVGMTGRAIGDTTADVCGSKRAVDRAGDAASTSGLRLPSAVRPAITATARRSCLGLRLLQG
jgi:hypothetical protein